MTKAEIISIGSELTSGRNLDTNSAWLSRELAEHGIEVGWHTTIADDWAATAACCAAVHDDGQSRTRVGAVASS